MVPEHAIDAQSLIAYADLVISAGGTMNREAVALGTPVYTTFQGRLGAVDERLIAEGRLRMLADAEELELRKRDAARAAARRACAAIRACSSSCCSRPLARLSRRRRVLRTPQSWLALTISAMRRRIRSAALPLHRHSLPQLAVDGALVALAYYLAFQLRFDSGPPGRQYAQPARRHDLVGGRWAACRCWSSARVYQRRWRYAGQRDYEAVVRAVVAIVLLTVVAIEVLRPGPPLPEQAHDHGASSSCPTA